MNVYGVTAMNKDEQNHVKRQQTYSRAGATVRMRCPECKKGILYRHGTQMNRLCPSCGIEFDREPGYFTGAIWISTLLAMPVMLFAMFGFLWFFRTMHPALAGILASVTFLPLIPLTIRLSRSIWMYFDHRLNPQRPDRDPPDRFSSREIEPPPDSPGIARSAVEISEQSDDPVQNDRASRKQEVIEV